MKRHVAGLLFWASFGALVGYDIGFAVRLYRNWPAPPAGYVWDHVACR